MSQRITLISMIDETEMRKVENLIKKAELKLCKMPYGIYDEKRYEMDNLPYHFTIFATNKENQDEMLELSKSINMEKIQVEIDDVKIMNGKHNSFVLYFSITENPEIKKLQRIFYKKFPKEKYNPDTFIFHMTIHIDKDYDRTLEIKKTIKHEFKPFTLEFNQVALFDYPGEMIQKIKFDKSKGEKIEKFTKG